MIRENSSRFTRRRLLAGLGFGVAAVGAIAAPALQLSWTRKPGAKGSWWDRQFTSLSHAGIEEWSRQIGAEFALAGGAVAGLWGILLSVPAVSVAKLLLAHFWETRVMGAEVTPFGPHARS